MHRTILSGIMLLLFSMLNAQTAEEAVMQLKQDQVSEVDMEQSVPEKGEEVTGISNKGQWNFSVGSSFAYSKAFGSGMHFYAAPTYSLALNQRWSVHGGVLLSTYGGLNYTQAGESLLPGSFTSFAAFAAASYRASDKLVVHGTGIKHLLSDTDMPLLSYPSDEFSLGATYKISDNLSVGASFHIQNGNGYRSSPFGSPLGLPMGSPLGSPMGSPLF